MNPLRLLLAAIVGGLAVFTWSAIDHMLLPIGEMGITSLPSEEILMPKLKESIKNSGLYMFPGFDPKNKSKEYQTAYEAKLRAGPTGLLVIQPAGGDIQFPKLLAIELLSNCLAAIPLAIILVWTRATKPQSAACGLLFGLFAWMSIDVSYWNWYKFPTAFTAGSLIDQSIGWLIGGFVIASVLGRHRRTPLVAA